MKIFDRYIVVSFLRNYVLSFIVLVGLYIALDMVFQFDELTKGDPSASGEMSAIALTYNIAEFYFYQTFVFFVQLSGVIPVAAAAFTLVRMMRFNELTAMLAAGVPIHRIAVPIVLAGVGLNALLIIDQELVIPNITHKLTRQHEEVGQTRGKSFSITALEDEAGSLLMAANYNPPGFDAGASLPPSMDAIDVIEFNKAREPVAHVQASRAVYNETAKAWELTDGKRQTGLRPEDDPRTVDIKQWKTDIGPDEIALFKRSSYVELLSLSQINALLDHPRNYGTVPLLRVKHWRFVQPLTNVILLLLATACMLTREPNTIKQTATRALGLTGICLASVFLSHQLAGHPPTPAVVWLWPALMLWLPLFVFAPLAVWMLDRVKT